jgi:hypothetical protein
MSFMTIVIFSLILFLIIFCIYNDLFSSSIFHKNYDVFYMIQQKQGEGEKDGPTILAYTAVVAAMIIPQIPQIDL